MKSFLRVATFILVAAGGVYGYEFLTGKPIANPQLAGGPDVLAQSKPLPGAKGAMVSNRRVGRVADRSRAREVGLSAKATEMQTRAAFLLASACKRSTSRRMSAALVMMVTGFW